MNNWGIHKRVLFIAIIPVVVIACVLLFYYIQAQTGSLDEALDEKGNLLAKRIATASEYALQTGNLASIEGILVASLEEDDVVAIAIRDSAGKLVLSRKKILSHPHQHPQITYRAPILTTEINIDSFGNDTANRDGMQKPSIGQVDTILSRTSTIHKQNEVIFNSIFITLIGIAASSFVALLIGRGVTRPIIELTGAVDKISHNKLDTRVHLASGGELGELERGINHMAGELQEFHERMQSRVDTATIVLRHSVRQLQEKNLELDQARNEAVSANRVKTEFLGNISHEILTPINNIIGSNNLLARATQAAERRRYSKIIAESSQNLVTIVHNILDLSRIETGTLVLSRRHFNLRELIEDTVISLADKAFDKGLELTLLFYDDVPTQLAGDPHRIRQILATLIDNAIKFTASGFITIRVMLEDEAGDDCTLKISIADTGIGIDPGARDMIFKAFTQADLGKTKEYSGVGLGLVIANTLIHQMHGSLDFTSEPGIGTTFWFTIQAELNQTHTTAAVNPPLPPAQEINALIYGRHAISRLSISHAIRDRVHSIRESDDIELLATTINAAASGADAFTTILLAINRDEIDEHKLASILQTITTRERYTIIALTDSTDAQVFSTMEAMGLDHCISKAFKKDDLCNLLSATHAQARTAHEGTAHILITDDNHINRHLLNTLLTQAGYTCSEASDGNMAVQLARDNHYDLIFMDIHMPVMDGIEAATSIRALDRHNRHIPVIAITANVTTEMARQIQSAGINDTLNKPVFEDQLYKITRRWLQAGTQTATTGDTKIQTSAPGAEPQAQDHYTGFDWNKAMRITGHNAALAQTLFEMFLADIPELLHKLNCAFADNNTDSLKAISHKIHGAAAYCAATRIDKISAELEKALLREQADLYPELVRSLNEEIGHLRAAATPV